MTSQDETMRLFVAVELPQTWLDTLATAQVELAAVLETPRTPRLRWVRPEAIHLTLKFIGNLPLARLDELRSVLKNAVTEPPKMSLTLGEPGFFTGPGGLVRVLWAGVSGDTRGLEDLASRVIKACDQLGGPLERRRFEPHLTLARVPDSTTIDADDMSRALEHINTLKAPSFDVEYVSLMRSHLGPGGARYERIAAFPAGS